MQFIHFFGVNKLMYRLILNSDSVVFVVFSSKTLVPRDNNVFSRNKSYCLTLS